MNPDALSLQAKLRQIDDYEHKGLLRAEEARSQRAAVQRRLLQVLMPDTPAPRVVAWRARLGAAAVMALLVGSVVAYLLSGHAGLRRRSEEALDAGKVAAAQSAIARQERLARLRAGDSLAPDENGVFPARRGAASAPASGAPPAAVAPLLAGQVTLDPALADKVAPDDALFVVVRLPDAPADDLPLAAMRLQAGNLPLDFTVGARELVGAPARFMQASRVVVVARIARSGSGKPAAGDLTGSAGPAPPWSSGLQVRIDHVLPAAP